MGTVAIALVLLAPGEKTELSWEEWSARAGLILDAPITTVEKIDRLKKAAAGVVLVERGKIVDIRPAARARPGDLAIDVCGVHGGEPRQTFLVKKADAQAVKGWTKWDRLAWRVTLRTDGLEVLYDVDYKGPASLTRTPNPGLRPIPHKTTARSYAEWRNLYVRYKRAGVWTRAWRLVESVKGKAFLAEATVTGRAEGAVSITYGDGATHAVMPVPDPQVMEVLVPGQRIEVGAFVVTGAEDAATLRALAGRIELNLFFRRLR